VTMTTPQDDHAAHKAACTGVPADRRPSRSCAHTQALALRESHRRPGVARPVTRPQRTQCYPRQIGTSPPPDATQRRQGQPLQQQTQQAPTTPHPRRAGRPPGWPDRKNRCGWAWAGRVGHPVGLPQGLPHDSPGAEPHDTRTGSVEGCPWAAAWSGCARPTGCHTSRNVQDL
jgi:hypothetical protein